jgi:hypothetical protein
MHTDVHAIFVGSSSAPRENTVEKYRDTMKNTEKYRDTIPIKA